MDADGVKVNPQFGNGPLSGYGAGPPLSGVASADAAGAGTAIPGIPFVITGAQKAALAALDYTAEQIRLMTPGEAHLILKEQRAAFINPLAAFLPDPTPPIPPVWQVAQADTPDFVTVATSVDDPPRRLTKLIYRRDDGRLDTKDFDDAYLYRFDTVPVGNLSDLARVLDGLGQTSCIVIGRVRDGVDASRARRTLTAQGDGSTLEDARHHWLPMDLDSIPAEDFRGKFDPVADPERAVRHVLSLLPADFHLTACHWRLTSGAGVKDGIRLRLVFWLSRPISGAEAKAWLRAALKSEGGILDGAIYTANQPIYAADPALADGVDNPVPQRSGIVQGMMCDTVRVPGQIDVRSSVRLPEVDGLQWDTPAALAVARYEVETRIAEGNVPSEGGRDVYNTQFLLRMHGLGLSADAAVEMFDLLLNKGGGLPPEGWPGDAKTLDKLRRIWSGTTGKHPPGSELEGAIRQWEDRRLQERFAGITQDLKECGLSLEPTTQDGSAEPADATAVASPWPEVRNARTHMHTVFEQRPFLWQDRLLAYEPNLITGLPGAGKTTLAENEAVCIAAGIPLFGFQTMPARVFMLIGEDPDGAVRDNLLRIRQELGLDDDVLDRIDWLSIKSTKIPNGHLLASIDEHGIVSNTAFMREFVVPRIQSYGGPVLFIVDPLGVFVALDRNKPLPAGAISRAWAEEICLLNNRRVTVQINDHPSNTSVEAGRHVSGDVQFRGGFSFTATLTAEKSLEVDGITQKTLTYQTLKPRYAAETETTLYRIGSSPLLKTAPARELDLAANMARVYQHVEERRATGERSFATAGNGKVERHGPEQIARVLGLTAELVRQAIRRLVAIYVYKDDKAEHSGAVDKRDPGGLMLGAFANRYSLDRWNPDMFVGVFPGAVQIIAKG